MLLSRLATACHLLTWSPALIPTQPSLPAVWNLRTALVSALTFPETSRVLVIFCTLAAAVLYAGGGFRIVLRAIRPAMTMIIKITMIINLCRQSGANIFVIMLLSCERSGWLLRCLCRSWVSKNFRSDCVYYHPEEKIPTLPGADCIVSGYGQQRE